MVGAYAKRWALIAAWGALGTALPLLAGLFLIGIPILILFSVLSAPTTGSVPATTAQSLQAVRQVYLADEQHAVTAACPQTTSTCGAITVPFVQAIMMAESAGNPLAHSSAGALGLMQVEPYHFPQGVNPLQPLVNIKTGVSILVAYTAPFQGNLMLTAAAYNAGVGGVQRLQRLAGSTQWPVVAAYIRSQPNLQAYMQTVHYVSTVMSFYAAFQKPYVPSSSLASGSGSSTLSASSSGSKSSTATGSSSATAPHSTASSGSGSFRSDHSSGSLRAMG